MSQRSMQTPDGKNPHIVLISQKVKDILPCRGNDLLAEETSKLRATLLQKGCIREGTEKVPSFIEPLSVDEQRNLMIRLSQLKTADGVPLADGVLGQLPINLPRQANIKDIQSALSGAPGVEVNDGGNIQNMTINLVYAIANSGIRDRLRRLMGSSIHITCASSSDPFDRVSDLWSEEGSIYGFRPLDLPDRSALQLYWKDEEKNTHPLSLTSPAARTGDAMSQLAQESQRFREELKKATNFMSADPIFSQIRQYAEPPYDLAINPSSVFRAEAVRIAYKQGVMLPMNRGEAVELCHPVLKDTKDSNGELLSPKDLGKHYFPSPFEEDKVNIEKLRQLDRSICAVRHYLPSTRMMDRFSFSESVSYGNEGGVLVGTRCTASDIACFTTIPAQEAGGKILHKYCEQEHIACNVFEVGAGDATACMVELFRAVDPQVYLGQVRAVSKEDLDNPDFVDLSSLVFVSLLSRLAGKFLIHTKQTNWASIVKKGKFEDLFRDMAKVAVALTSRLLARGRISDTPRVTRSDETGIDVLVWRVSRLHHNQNANNLRAKKV